MNATEYYHAEIDYRRERLRAYREPSRVLHRARVMASRAVRGTVRAKSSR